MTEVIDSSCGGAPTFDDEYVYYQGGKARNQLWRRRKDLTEPGQMIDPNCGSTPTLDGEFIYFQGGQNKDTLARRPKDGSGRTEVLEKYCYGTPVIDEDFIYYIGGDSKASLMRRPKSGGTPVLIGEYCRFTPVIDGDYVYYVGGMTGGFLVRRKKDGSSTNQSICTTCMSQPVIDGDLIYFIYGTNPASGWLYRMYKDGRSITDQLSKVELYAAARAPTIYKNFAIFESSAHRHQLSGKSKSGTGAMVRLADYCGSQPVIDGFYVYILTTTTFTTLARLPLPAYFDE
jgi:hypothetical protein